MKLKLLVILLVNFLTIELAGASLKGSVEWPEDSELSYSELELQMYSRSGAISEERFAINQTGDFVITDPVPGSMLIVQAKNKNALEKMPRMFLVARLRDNIDRVEVSPTTTVSYLFAQSLRSEYNRLAESEQIKIDKIAEQHGGDLIVYITKKLKENDFDLSSNKDAEYRQLRLSTLDRIKEEVRAAVSSGHIDRDAESNVPLDPDNDELLRDFISCKENPETFQKNPKAMMKMRRFVEVGTRREGEFAKPKQDMLIFGAKVDQVLLGV